MSGNNRIYMEIDTSVATVMISITPLSASGQRRIRITRVMTFARFRGGARLERHGFYSRWVYEYVTGKKENLKLALDI